MCLGRDARIDAAVADVSDLETAAAASTAESESDRPPTGRPYGSPPPAMPPRGPGLRVADSETIPTWRFRLERNRSQRGGRLEPVRAPEMDQARDSPVDPDHERIGRFRFGPAWIALLSWF